MVADRKIAARIAEGKRCKAKVCEVMRPEVKYCFCDQ
jgi:hypothetical protein